MIVSHKIQFKDLTQEQVEHFRQSCGVARFTYNWALDKYKKQLEVYKQTQIKEDKPNIQNIKKEFNKIRREEFPWTYDVSKCASARAFTNLQNAFSRFFNKSLNSKFPRFKSKNKSNSSFYIDNSVFIVGTKEDNKARCVKLPMIGVVKLTESLRFEGKIMSGTVSEQGNKWFISVCVDITDNPDQFTKDYTPDVNTVVKDSNTNNDSDTTGKKKYQTKDGLIKDLNIKNYKQHINKSAVVGVDLGIKTAIFTSDGEEIQAPKPLKRYLKKLKRLQRRMSKKVGGTTSTEVETTDNKGNVIKDKQKVVVKSSNNREKAKQKVKKLYYKVGCIRRDWLHKTSKYLCGEYMGGVIALEDLHVKGMTKNHKLARAILDIGLSTFRTYVTYKSIRFNTELRIVDRWYPSSKLCSLCHTKKSDLTLSDREYKCDNTTCKYNIEPIDRDYNASLNISRCPVIKYEILAPRRTTNSVTNKNEKVDLGTG